MSSTFGANLRVKLIELGIAQPEDFVGCNLTEIEEIKEAQHVTYLPPLYDDFLLTMGKFAGRLLESYVSLDGYYPTLLYLKSYALELVKENGNPFMLPDDAFVFLMDRGNRFMYFLTGDQNTDPSLYHYEKLMPAEYAPSLEWLHLSEFLINLSSTHKRKNPRYGSS